MTEAMCITNHEQPGKEAGKFKRYVAGQVYEIPEDGLNRYFKRVKTGTLKKLADEKKAREDAAAAGKTTEENTAAKATGKGGTGK